MPLNSIYYESGHYGPNAIKSWDAKNKLPVSGTNILMAFDADDRDY